MRPPWLLRHAPSPMRGKRGEQSGDAENALALRLNKKFYQRARATHGGIARAARPSQILCFQYIVSTNKQQSLYIL